MPAAGALVVLQNFFAEPDGFGSDLDELVVGDEFDGLLEAQLAMGDEANGFVSRGRAHVGELLFLGDVDFHVLLAGIFADDHTFVHFDAGADEKFAAFLESPEGVGGGGAGPIGDERTGGTEGHVAAVFNPAIEDGMDQRSAACVGEELATQADQSARGDFEIEADAAGAVIAHFDHFATAAAYGFHDDADEAFGDINDEAFNGFELLAVFGVDNDFRFADHEFETFAAHGFDEDGELEFAAAENTERLRSVGIFDADGDVGEKFASEAVAKVARSEIGAFAAAERAGVDGEDHSESRLVDRKRLEGCGIFEGSDAFTDLNTFHPGDGGDVARRNGFGFVALEAAESVELGDFGGEEFAIELADADLVATGQSAVEDAANGEAAEKLGVIEIGDLKLKNASGIAGRRGDFIYNGFE